MERKWLIIPAERINHKEKNKMQEKNTNNRDRKSPTLELTLIAMMAAVIAVCSWIAIPTTIPFTLQTFAVFLTLMLLGGKSGTVAIVLYIVLGAIGLPVFANFNGGLGALTGPTGGYIIGFLFCGIIYLLFFGLTKKWYIQIIALIIGLAVCYAFGTAWFITTMGAKGNEYTVGAALAMCVTPYLIPDGVKLAVAFIVSKQLKRIPLLRDRK